MVEQQTKEKNTKDENKQKFTKNTCFWAVFWEWTPRLLLTRA
jgi:hypothetical protein